MTGGRRAVIFVVCRYEMLFWEIKDGRVCRGRGGGGWEKKRAPGMLV